METNKEIELKLLDTLSNYFEIEAQILNEISEAQTADEVERAVHVLQQLSKIVKDKVTTLQIFYGVDTIKSVKDNELQNIIIEEVQKIIEQARVKVNKNGQKS